MTNELIHWVTAAMELKLTALTPRDRRIIAHYEREIAKGRMSLTYAFERCCSDIQGRNNHPSKPQRGKTYRAVTLNVIGGHR